MAGGKIVRVRPKGTKNINQYQPAKLVDLLHADAKKELKTSTQKLREILEKYYEDRL